MTMMIIDEGAMFFRETKYKEKLDPDMYTIIRLDGRNFTQLCKVQKIAQPFNYMFRESLVEVTSSLLKHTGYEIVYGYTHSDEINLLLRKDMVLMNREPAALLSSLASAAGAYFTKENGFVGVFSGAIHQAKDLKDVGEYFMWRKIYAANNTLAAYIKHHVIQANGGTAADVGVALHGKNYLERVKILKQAGVDWLKISGSIRNGIAVYWRPTIRSIWNDDTQELHSRTSRSLHVDFDLPKDYDYKNYVYSVIRNNYQREREHAIE
jgi:tRNA(His) guanylyltransferase